MTQPSEETEPQPEGHVPFLKGTFALYLTPKGDVILATNSDMAGDQTVRVPAFVVKQARKSNPMLAAAFEKIGA
jgi:hypothetical protein